MNSDVINKILFSTPGIKHRECIKLIKLMNVKILFCTILLLIRIQLSGQEAKNNLTISSGIILDDGFVYRPSVPVMGLGYSYKLNKFLSVDAGLFSIYKTIGDHTVLGNDPMKKNSLMLSLHSYNFFWSHDNTETNHLLTIDFQSSF